LIFSDLQVSLDEEVVTETVKGNAASAGRVAYKQVNKIRKQDKSSREETQTSTEASAATDGQKTVSYARIQRSDIAEVVCRTCMSWVITNFFLFIVFLYDRLTVCLYIRLFPTGS